MVSNIHYIELFINKEQIELESQKNLNLRINNVLFNPAKTTTKQTEYSFSFDIPSTPSNDRILNYANNLSRINKFHARYPAQVYADGKLIFSGSLTIQKYSAKSNMYTCNLVNIKIDTLDEIFGETKMSELKWEVPFDGAPTINAVNLDKSTKYFFPFISYGVFQKEFVTKDDVAATYTPKHDIDKYNKFWVETFYPSLNMMETIRKAFQSKGYNSIGGSAFSDPYINNIYCSTNLAQEQTPIYNLGNPKFGALSLSIKWNNYSSNSTRTSFSGNRRGFFNNTGGYQQDLSFPYGYIKPAINASNNTDDPEYNFSSILLWNMLDSDSNANAQVTVNSPTYMYDPGEHLIVIPADGWYKIDLEVDATLSGNGTTFQADQWTTTYYQNDEFKERPVTLTRTFKEHTPLEIQLIRNYDDNVELIKGKKNITYDTGDPNQETYTIRGGSYTGSTEVNKQEWDTDFPHQESYGSKPPTKTENLIATTTSQRTSSLVASSGHVGTTRSGNVTTGRLGGRRGASDSNTYGYIHRDGYVMPYDQAVSEAFICGFSSLSDGTVSVMRNGSSWSRMCSVNNRIFADVKGMDLVNKTDSGTETIETDYCKNTYKYSTNSCYANDSTMIGVVNCCVWLNKNDILEVVAVQRDFNNSQMYSCSAKVELQITAMSDKTEEELKGDPYWGYYSTTQFPYNLNLFNFTNNETKVTDWINNIAKAFNLEIIQDGNVIDINTNQGIKKDILSAVDIDDRVNSEEVESEYISYPKEMSVKYKIDTKEYGFELTVPEEHINDDEGEWQKWGDSGFTVIQLNDDTYETSSQNTQTNFSYTYYDNFTWKEVLLDGTESGAETNITIPVIELSEYMAEGYGYEDAMKHDGYSLTQRFWYRGEPSQQYVYLSDHLKEQVFLTYTKNEINGFNLSYKDSEKSIVTEYFNLSPMLSSNYVTIDVYINPEEYNMIKGGALVHFDSDLYYTSEISGYDPSGGNQTTLKLIKRV